jgi:hypothetical protein
MAGLNARDTVEGCTPHLVATSLMVGRDEAAGLAARRLKFLSLRTIRRWFRHRRLCPAAGTARARRRS